MSTYPITSKICPTCRVECGNNRFGNAFLVGDNKLITVRHVVSKAIFESNPADILVHYRQNIIKCEIVNPYSNKSLSDVTVVLLQPKGNESNNLLLDGFSVALFDDTNKSMPYTIGYLACTNEAGEFTKEARGFVTYDEIEEVGKCSKKERQNYAFNPKLESLEDFQGLSGSPVFIADGFFGLLNYEKSVGEKIDRVVGFCGKEFFEELFTSYGIKVYTKDGRTYEFSSTNTPPLESLIEQEKRPSEQPSYSIPDQFAKDCFDSYNDHYSKFWADNRDTYPCLKEFDRLISYAWNIPWKLEKESEVRTALEAKRKEAVEKAIVSLMDEQFLSPRVDGNSREECISWILGAKYWQIFESIDFENITNPDWPDQATRLHALLSVKPEHIPDFPQRHLIAGLLWFPFFTNANRYSEAESFHSAVGTAKTALSYGIESAKEAFVAAIDLCTGKWNNTNCHAEAHCLLGNIMQWEDPELSIFYFDEAEKRFKDKIRRAEFFRRMAMLFKHLNLYSHAISWIKKAIKEDYSEPQDTMGLRASYIKLLDICSVGSKQSCSPSVQKECERCAIEALGKYREIIDVPESSKQLFNSATDELSNGNRDIIPLAMLFEIFFKVYKNFSQIERWSESVLLEQISNTFCTRNLSEDLSYTHKARNGPPILVAWVKNEDIKEAMGTLLRKCIVQDNSMLFTVAPVTTSDYEIFKERWKEQCKMVSAIDDFTIIAEPLRNQAWIDDKKIRVYFCVFEDSNGKQVYVLHMICHTR